MFPFDFSQQKRQYQVDFSPPEEDYTGMEQEEENPYSIAPPSKPSFMDLYKQMAASKKTQAFNKYQNFLNQGVPQPDNVSPLTRIGAILSGAGIGLRGGPGAETATNILQTPYKNKLARWGTEEQGLQKLAGLEEAQNKNDLTGLKAVADIENDRIREERLQKAAEGLAKHRGVLEENAKRALELQGLRIVRSDITGEDMLVDIETGKTKSLGKFRLSEPEKEAKGEKEFQRAETGRNERAKFGREAAFGRVKFGAEAAAERQEDQQAFQLEMLTRRTDENIRRSIAVAGIRNPSAKQLEETRKNWRVVQALVQADPGKYTGVWETDPTTGYAGLTRHPISVDDPRYAAYVELYNALYKGVINPATGKEMQLNPAPTKGGNTFTRRPGG
jgi:hypothetical protein